MCSPYLVGKYLQLDAKLSEFARSQVYAVDIMQNELQVIADILVLLEQELQSDTARHNNLLFGNHQDHDFCLVPAPLALDCRPISSPCR